MAEKQKKPAITGYRVLSDNEIALLNKIKEKAVEVGELCSQLKDSGQNDIRWVNIGITDLQKGFMALARAVARPTTF